MKIEQSILESAETRVLDILGDERDNLDEILVLSRELVISRIKEGVAANAILDLVRQRLGLAKAHAEVAEKNVHITAAQETNLAILRNRELKIAIQNERRLFLARKSFTVQPGVEELALAQNAVDEERERLRLIRLRGQEDLKNLDVLISQATEAATIDGLVRQRLEREKELNNELELQNIKLAKAKDSFDLEAFKGASPYFAGTLEAMRLFITEGLDKFKLTVSLMTDIFNGFVRTAASAIVSIFDPSNTESARQKWGRFLLQIAEQIIAMLIHVALIQQILLPWLSSFQKKMPTPRWNMPTGKFYNVYEKGVRIPANANYPASPAHFGAPGFLQGGQPNSRDSVPIWTQPGEHVIRKSSASKYGAHVMESINRGLIDPLALRSLAGARRISAALATPRRPHFNSGGLIGDRLRALESAGPPSGGESKMPSMGFLLATEETMETLLAKGKNALFSFFEENAPHLRSIMSN